jgi:hypothetical protein
MIYYILKMAGRRPSGISSGILKFNREMRAPLSSKGFSEKDLEKKEEEREDAYMERQANGMPKEVARAFLANYYESKHKNPMPPFIQRPLTENDQLLEDIALQKENAALKKAIQSLRENVAALKNLVSSGNVIGVNSIFASIRRFKEKFSKSNMATSIDAKMPAICRSVLFRVSSDNDSETNKNILTALLPFCIQRDLDIFALPETSPILIALQSVLKTDQLALLWASEKCGLDSLYKWVDAIEVDDTVATSDTAAVDAADAEVDGSASEAED